MVHLISTASRSIVRRGEKSTRTATSTASRTVITYWNSTNDGISTTPSPNCRSDDGSSAAAAAAAAAAVNVIDQKLQQQQRTFVSMVNPKMTQKICSTSSTRTMMSIVKGLQLQHQQQGHLSKSNNKFCHQKRFLSSSSKEDFYKILGVNKGDDKGTIKKAYFKLAKKFHPDTNKVSLYD